ncbi:MAG TPA: VOC family protein [Polyangiaceae bacterium]|jgi:predicted enzyme related to lactoylglutathione lyase
MRVHFILYVRDQAAATAFYARVLDVSPSLDVPGMTEINLGGATLGLMPERGIAKLLDGAIDPSASSVPRAEVYLVVADPESLMRRALAAGGRELSPIAPRDWGHRAGYVLDPDGHVVAFASAISYSSASKGEGP